MAETWHNRLARHFDLRLPRRERAAAPAGGEAVPQPARWATADIVWVAVVYLVQVLGVIGKQVYDDASEGRALHLPLGSILVAFIVSAASFPAVHKSLQAESDPALRLFLAFQSGFFWRSVLGNIMPA